MSEIQRTIRVLAAALTAVVVGAGCASGPNAQAPLEVQLTTLQLMPEGSSEGQYGVTLLLRNPNIEPFVARSVEFSIRLGPGGIIEGMIPVTAPVPALEEVRVQATVSGALAPSPASLLAYLQGPQRTLPYELEGKIWLPTRPPVDLPFARQGQVPLAMSAGP